jgi:hypothetical protein
MEFFTYFQTFLTVAASLHGTALVICNLTNSPKDDEAVARVYKLIEIFAGIVTPRAKQ